MKWIFKWLLRLFILVIVVIVIFILSLDSILRLVVEHNIRAQTGMDAEIGRFHVGLLEPVIEIQNLKLYNPPAFGGTPFLDIPEIHAEYDPVALADHKIHLTLLRFNLGELDIVKNEAGQTNILAMGVATAAGSATSSSKETETAVKQAMNEFKQRTQLSFQSIDVLNVSVGKARYIDLKDQRNNRTQVIGIDNFPVRNIKSPADLSGLALLVALRSGDFLGPMIAPQH
jgi:uncharacterized protein involved in outer membrane biogenesis